jgi:hypothetical protein
MDSDDIEKGFQPENSQTLKIPFDTNISSWDNSSEEIAKNIAENCQGYKFMHYINSRYYSRINSVCMYASMIICPLAGTLSAINVYLNGADSNTTISIYISIVIALITYIAGVKISIVKFSKFNEKSNLHVFSSKKYSQLENSVRVQLMLSRKNRIDAKIYLNWLTKTFDEIYQSSPVINSWVYNDYMSKVQNEGILFPGKYDSVVNINKQDTIQDVKEENSMEKPHAEFHPEIGYLGYSGYNKAQMNYEMSRLMGL